jgi:hypothetical protein
MFVSSQRKHNMKLSLITTLLFFTSSFSYAQSMIGDGNRMIGGGISFSNQEDEGDRVRQYSNSSSYRNYNKDSRSQYSSFSIRPYYGKFFNEDVLVGFGFNYTNRSSEFISQDSIEDYRANVDQFNFGLNFFIKRYIAVSDKFGVYLSPKIGYTRSRFKQISERIDNFVDQRDYGYEEISYSNNGYGRIDMGLYFFIFDQLSIETTLLSANISFTKTKWEFNDLVKEEEFDGSNNQSDINLSFVNSFTFDKLFVLNYFF